MESTVEVAKASQAGQEAKVDIKASKKGKTWHSRICGINLIIHGETRLMGYILWKFQPKVSVGS